MKAGRQRYQFPGGVWSIWHTGGVCLQKWAIGGGCSLVAFRRKLWTARRSRPILLALYAPMAYMTRIYQRSGALSPLASNSGDKLITLHNVDYRRLNTRRKPHQVVNQKASRTIFPLILEFPATRSTNVIGISTILNLSAAARRTISI